VLNFLKLITST